MNATQPRGADSDGAPAQALAEAAAENAVVAPVENTSENPPQNLGEKPVERQGVAAFTAASRPAIGRGLRLQWEAAQSAHVLLYPEGMIKLNTSAGEILKRCDGVATLADITADLERAFETTNLTDDVHGFVAMALEKKWLRILP